MKTPSSLEITQLRSQAEEDPRIAVALTEVQKEIDALQPTPTQPLDLLPYIATPVDEALRQRLQQFLSMHPDLDQEAAWSKLLELGLQKALELSTYSRAGTTQLSKTLGMLSASSTRGVSSSS